MILIFKLSLFLTFLTLSVCQDSSLKSDSCSKFDNCASKSVLRTCSCDSNCHVYGTCCREADKTGRNITVLHCYSRRTVSPVFAKRSCPEDFRGHVGVAKACLDDDEDEMDVRNNLLMTSLVTKVTYWNKHCAACNYEPASDLEFWSIVVTCPAHKEVDRYLIRKNLTFDQDKLQWGLEMEDAFLQCDVKYSPPPYVNEVKHCTPNLIASCPASYKNEAIATKCSTYYAERKLKNSDTVFRNIHCAICNDVAVEDLECPGLFSPEHNVEESDFQDTVEEIFTNGVWLVKHPGKEFECSRGFLYDPFQEKCRRSEIKEKVTMVLSSAQTYGKAPWAVLVISVALLLKGLVFVQLFAAEQSF